MEFNRWVGTRRSVRYFKTWQPVEKDKIQRILETARWTTCPGNLQPWRVIVVYRDELDEASRELLLKADNWQGAHVQAPVWIYWFGDVAAARPDAFVGSKARPPPACVRRPSARAAWPCSRSFVRTSAAIRTRWLPPLAMM